MNSAKFLIIITGPTASGKTDTSIEIAKHFNAEIFSCDSRQFYKQLNIGVAKPDEFEMQKVKHHFIGHIDITEHYSISKYENDLISQLEKYYNTNNIAILTGGSGLYIDAVCNGVDEMPDFDPQIRRELNDKYNNSGIEALRFELLRVDPDYFNSVDLKNPKRILRALEVYYQTGIPFSEFRKNKKIQRNFEIIKLGINLDRDKLYERINNRVDIMIDNGLVDEAKSLYSYKNLVALKTIGYSELFMFFEGKCSKEETVELIKRNSRRYARRQITWFRRDKNIEWFSSDKKIYEIIDYINNIIDRKVIN